MIVQPQSYVSTDLAVIVPTRNRPKKVRRLLQSIIELDCEVGRIIIIASGIDIGKDIMEFSQNLPVEYLKSERGQIKQRNKGIAILDKSTKLVATLDDDAVIHKTAVSEIINFWNRVEPETAGVGFNIVNLKGHRHSWVKGVLGVSVPEPGRVLKSGYNTTITNIHNDIKTEWLTGGSTVWRQEILKKYPHQEIISNWSVCEDLIFSYPIGRKYPLYVSFSSKIDIEDVVIHNEIFNVNYLHYKTLFLWHLYFVLLNNRLSVISFSWFKFIEMISMLTEGILHIEFYRLFRAAGTLSGLFLSLNYFVRKKTFQEIIEENT